MKNWLVVSTGGFIANVGRYGAKGRFTSITEGLRNAVFSRLGGAEPQGITQIRTALRGVIDPTTKKNYVFTNQSMAELSKEFKAIKNAGGKEITVGMKFGSKYRYFGTARLVDESGNIQEVPLMFGSNTRLSNKMIRQRFESTAEQVQAKGGIRNRDGNYELGDDIVIEEIKIDAKLKSAA